jgi:hypothetical protein
MARSFTPTKPASWDNFHERFEVKRINHQEAYSLDGACTGLAEEYLSRLGRAEIGIHHHIAGAYFLRYAQESSWREDNRRVSDRNQVTRITALVLTRAASASRRTTSHPGTGQAARLCHCRSRLDPDLRCLGIDRNHQADLLQSIALCFAGFERRFRAPCRHFSRRGGASSLSSRFFKLLLLKLLIAVAFDGV